jgi:hypothetical protein
MVGVVVARGPRALERRLLAAVLAELVGGEEAALESMARPVRVVVPSRALAQQVAARLVECAGRPVLGVRVETLHAVAAQLGEGSGPPRGAPEALLPVAVRRAARAEPVLREALDGLAEGYAVVQAAVVDLLDAGFEPPHAEALEEAVARTRDGRVAARAGAVVRVARRVAEGLEAGRFGHRSALFRAARERLEKDPEGALPTRALFVHGFADATGLQTDLLEALLRHPSATLLLDRPADPADPARDDPGRGFAERFRERLLGGEPLPAAGSTPPPTALSVLCARAPESEARAAAERLREQLDAGAVPERLAVVARNLAAYRAALRVHLERLGVPFSGLQDAGPTTPAGRRLTALRQLVRDGERTPVETWLEIVARLRGATLTPQRRADLRSAFHALGVARVGGVAASPTADEGAPDSPVPLPVRGGLAVSGAEAAPLAPRRSLARAHLDAAIRAARALVANRREASAARSLGAHVHLLLGLVSGALGWHEGDVGCDELVAACGDGGLGPAEAALDADEFGLVLAHELARAGRAPLGGAGAGVQILDVTEARGLTFDALFLVGMNRDVFPRPIVEDPLLPDGLRARLRAVVPDLPIKSLGHDEERFLFAQLLASSPRVTLCYALEDGRGAARAPSPLVERLRLATRAVEPEVVPSRLGAAALESRAPRPVHEHALLAALHGGRAGLAALLPLALAEARRELGEADGVGAAAAIAAGRLAVLAELDALPHGRPRAGPYFGFVGRPCDAADPRRAPLYVTTLERFVACPWQTFLSRCLRLAPGPDAVDALPGADPRRVGALVHALLAELVPGAGPGGELAEVVARAPGAPAWPEDAQLDRRLRERALAMLRDEGVVFPGLERVLALAARAYLDAARRLEPAAVALLGTEVPGVIPARGRDGSVRELRFVADRVELSDRLRIVDFKTGRAAALPKRPEGRRAELLARVSRGELLQAPAYVVGARELGVGPAEGVYRNLSPDAPEHVRSIAFEARDSDLDARFQAVVETALDAWESGSFPPRLVEPDGVAEPRRCRHCDVKEACHRGDSGVRRRVAAFADAPPHRLSAAEQAWSRVWALPETPRRPLPDTPR